MQLTKTKLEEIYGTWELKERLLELIDENDTALKSLRDAARELADADRQLKTQEATLACDPAVAAGKNEATRNAALLKLAKEDPTWQQLQSLVKDATEKRDAAKETVVRKEKDYSAVHDVIKLTVAEMNLATFVFATANASPTAPEQFYAEFLVDSLAEG